jgi:hypothetical protein
MIRQQKSPGVCQGLLFQNVERAPSNLPRLRVLSSLLASDFPKMFSLYFRPALITTKSIAGFPVSLPFGQLTVHTRFRDVPLVK